MPPITKKKDEPVMTEFERLCSHIPTDIFVAVLSRASLSDVEARELASRFKALKGEA